MGDAFDVVRTADPAWWSSRIAGPLSASGLLDATSQRVIPPAAHTATNELREQEAALVRLVTDLNRLWARYSTKLTESYAVQNQVEELVVTRVRSDVEEFFSAARAHVFERILHEHRWYTGLQDGGKVVARKTVDGARLIATGTVKATKRVIAWVERTMPSRAADQGTLPTESPGGPATVAATDDSASQTSEHQAVQFIEVILAEHVNQELIGQAVNASLAKAADEVRSLWAHTLERLLESAERVDGPLSQYFAIGRPGEAELDRSFEILVSGSLSAVGATLALAAGWHTIWWALAHLFPGAILGAALLAGLYAWFNKDRAREKIRENAMSVIDALRERVTADVEVYIRKDARENARRTGANLRRLLFRAQVGASFDPELLADLIRALESLLDQVSRRSHAVETRQEAVLRRRLETALQLAGTRLDADDLPGAAFMLGQAIELLLRVIGTRLGQGSASTTRQGYMLEFIDLMRNEGLVTKEQGTRLHRLRQQRNWLFHDYDSVAETHGTGLAQWIRDSLTLLRQLSMQIT